MSVITSSLLFSPQEFFQEKLERAFQHRNITTTPLVKNYLTELLKGFILTTSLYEEEESTGKLKTPTLAEMYLKALAESSESLRADLLKRLGDSSLYISGFFGDSLKRKVVDIDYYADIGGSAYATLANASKEGELRDVFKTFSVRFMDFVDVLTHVSQESFVQSNNDLLRLYERMHAGSGLAKNQLQEKGVLYINTEDIKKSGNQ